MDKLLIVQRIDNLLEHIDLILNDTKEISFQDLDKSSLLLRATCFSISQIGEIMNHLEKELSNKYANLPWISARRMRNMIVHDYVGTDIQQVYSTIKLDLPMLKDSFMAIRKDLISNY